MSDERLLELIEKQDKYYILGFIKGIKANNEILKKENKELKRIHYLIQGGRSNGKTYLTKLQQENAQLKEENQALHTLVEWAEQCGFGFDNFTDDVINWEEFEKESKNMDYIESMIHYAKKYNEALEGNNG